MKRLLLAVTILAALSPHGHALQAREECYCGAPAGGASEPCAGTRVVYKLKEVDKPAKIKKRVEPGYTNEAKDNGVTGVVRLRVVLCPSGEVRHVSVVKELPDGLTELCVAAAKKIKFEPAEKGGQKVAQYATIEYVFRF